MATYAGLRIAVLLVTSFVIFTNIVYGAPIELANNVWKHTTNLEPLVSQTIDSQLQFSTNEIQKNLHAVLDMSQAVSAESTTGQMTSPVKSVVTDDHLNTTDTTSKPPPPETESTNKITASTVKPLDVTEEQKIILESSSFTISRAPSNTPTTYSLNTNDLTSLKSTNIMTLTTSSSSEPVTGKSTKEDDKVTKTTDAATIPTTVESSDDTPTTVPNVISTNQNTEIHHVTTEVASTELPKDTTYKTTEFSVAADLKGTTAYVPIVTGTVPMTEFHKSTIVEDPSTLAKILTTNTSQSTKIEQTSTATINEITELPTTNPVTDSNPKVSEYETVITEIFNKTSTNLLQKDDSQQSLPEPDKTLNTSSETTFDITTSTNSKPVSIENFDKNETTATSKEAPSSVHIEETKSTTEDVAKTTKNVEMNEIDNNSTPYQPIRKEYTAIDRRKTNPIREAPVSTHQNIVTEQTAKTSKKHLNVWVADLKLPDSGVITSIPRNPTSTMYPTLMDPTTTVLNAVVSRRAGYINNVPSIEQDVDKLPSSTNPVRASNPTFTDAFPNYSILDISSTVPSYSSTFFDDSTVITTPLTHPTQALQTTPAQVKESTMLNSISSEVSNILPKNITAELTEFIETDVIPLSPTLIQQMRLVDDALKEEFMKEMALSLTKKLATLNKTTTDNVDEENLSTTTNPLNVANVTEKSRNITLYKVNPNYKPLKRLEIQPSKQFTIDPDDNSWRNESINSRGVVFKANNSSIVFTQVLKNKTEAELNNTKLSNKDSKDERPELRERLEKLAEKRKYKKKYNTSGAATEDIEDIITTEEPQQVEVKPITRVSRPSTPPTTTELPIYNRGDDAYEANEDEDEQLVKITHFDILKSSQAPIEPSVTYFPPNRKGTIQYFPPRKTNEQVKYNINFFATENTAPFTNPGAELLTTNQPKHEPPKGRKSIEPFDPKWRKEPESENQEVPHSGAYVIKHYRDFLRHATGGGVDDRKSIDEYPVHSEVLSKIVDDFNKNSEQFKVDFPVMYNTSIEHGGSAASRTYVRRLHEARSRETRPGGYLAHTKRYDPTCENLTVELNPAYELHYYVPDQEERQDPSPIETYHIENL